jgi:ribonuclease T1
MPANSSTGRAVGGVLVAVLAAVLLWWTQGGSGDPAGSAPHDPVSTRAGVQPSGDASTDPDSGLPVIDEAQLPSEARDVLVLIDAGGPFAYPDHDGGTFENREELLPDRPYGYYREYTVESSPGVRGPRRIIAGDDGELYWTDDHYGSFARIVR